jgi:glycosyltransferase involved in cell wall biosynthesis
MNNTNLKISVIVACYNAEKTILKTIESIVNQTYKNIELIVVDGLSTDNTVRIIESFSNKIDKLIVEKDTGIPNAYNKGIKACKGDWVYFLNADDVFYNNEILNLIATDLSQTSENLFIGRVASDSGRIFDGKLNFKLLFKNTVHHQGVFYKKFFIDSNLYNEKYKRYGHDYEHNLKIWISKEKVRYSQRIIALWSSGGISDMANWDDYKEEFKVRFNAIGSKSSVFNIFTVARFFFKVLKRRILNG